MAEKCDPYLESFAPFRATGKRVRVVIKEATLAGNPIPLNDKSIDMCVSYHVKGICNSNCGRKRDHTKHTDGETARLMSW